MALTDTPTRAYFLKTKFPFRQTERWRLLFLSSRVGNFLHNYRNLPEAEATGRSCGGCSCREEIKSPARGRFGPDDPRFPPVTRTTAGPGPGLTRTTAGPGLTQPSSRPQFGGRRGRRCCGGRQPVSSTRPSTGEQPPPSGVQWLVLVLDWLSLSSLRDAQASRCLSFSRDGTLFTWCNGHR